MSEVISLYVVMISAAIPVAFTWFVCDLIATSLLRVITGGSLRLGRGVRH